MANEYVTLAALKLTLNITTTTWDADLQAALSAASKAIERDCGRRFWADAAATNIRYFTPSEAWAVTIDDLVTCTSVAVDTGGTGTFGTTWTSGTHFDLSPYNAAADSEPYTRLELRSSATMPNYTRSIKITGKWGWPAVPDDIVQATSIYASRLFKRAREAPFSVFGVGVDGASVRISRTDPDVAALITPFNRSVMIL